MLVRKYLGSSSEERALICRSAVICGPGSEMDCSEEDQKVAVSAASAMSLKRSISSLDLAPLARAARARRSAQPSNKEGLEDPTLETPLKDTGLPPSPPLPHIDGRTLSDLEVLFTIATTGDGARRRSSDSATRPLHSGVNDLGPLRCAQVTAKM